MRRLLSLLLPAAAMGQILTPPGDAKFPGRPERAVAIAGSPFEVWVAYPRSLVAVPRLGPQRPRWFGSEQGLPSDGIASICFDDPSQSLWIRSVSGGSWRWTPGLESAREEVFPVSGCSSKTSRPVLISDLPPLFPSSPGWIQSGADLVSPYGSRQHVRLGLVLDERDLWIATDFGLWTGNAQTGRIEPVPLGLPESCILSAQRDRAGQAWLLGCHGSLSVVDASDRFVTSFLPDDSRLPRLRAPRLLGPAGSNGLWISVLDGLIRVDPDGLQEKWIGKKAPPGGRTLSCLEYQDTLWCGTEGSLVRMASSERSFSEDPPPWTAPSPVHTLAATTMGLVAATTKGFWWRGPHGWERPSFLSTDSAPVHLLSVEPVEPKRVAWTRGTVLHVDTVAGHLGRAGKWFLDGAPSSVSFDPSGRIHLALGGSWAVWDIASGEHRDWKSGLGLQGDVTQVLAGPRRALLIGPGGAISLEIAPYAPPSTNPK